MLLTMLFFVRVFLIPVKRPYVQLSSPGQTEGVTLRDAKTGIKDRYEPGM